MPHVIELAGRVNRSSDIALDEAKSSVVRQVRDVRARPSDQVIQPDDFSSIRKQAIAQVGPDETRRPGNKMAQ